MDIMDMIGINGCFHVAGEKIILSFVLVALLAMPAVVEEYEDPLRWRCGKLQLRSI